MAALRLAVASNRAALSGWGHSGAVRVLSMKTDPLAGPPPPAPQPTPPPVPASHPPHHHHPNHRPRRIRAGPRPSWELGRRARAAQEQEVADRNSGRRPSFHGRDFPASLVDYRSAEGRLRLERALAAKTAEQYLNLTAAYQMQSEPAYCALTTVLPACLSVPIIWNENRVAMCFTTTCIVCSWVAVASPRVANASHVCR